MAKITTIGDYFSTKLGLVNASLTIAGATGPAIDRLGYDHLLAVLSTTSLAGTAATQDVKLQHSTTNASGFVDYTPDFVYQSNNTNYTTAAFIQLAAASSGSALKLDVDLQKANRYIRFQSVGTGTTGGAISVVALLTQNEGTIPGGLAGA